MAQEVQTSGIRAVARGALEAGVEFAASYPGGRSPGSWPGSSTTPRSACTWSGVRTRRTPSPGRSARRWSAGGRWRVKHVGLSVASDAVTAAAFTGISGALVIATGADPGGRVSQNEMDERPYADLFMLPMLEPSSPADAARITRYAFELSERTGAPVLLRVSSAFLRISESLPPQPSPPPDDGERSFRYEATPERTALGRFILDSNRNRQRRFARAGAELESAGSTRSKAMRPPGSASSRAAPPSRPCAPGSDPRARPRASSACDRSIRCRNAPSPPSRPASSACW